MLIYPSIYMHELLENKTTKQFETPPEQRGQREKETKKVGKVKKVKKNTLHA